MKYLADDGKVFDTIEECQQYENFSNFWVYVKNYDTSGTPLSKYFSQYLVIQQEMPIQTWNYFLEALKRDAENEDYFFEHIFYNGPSIYCWLGQEKGYRRIPNYVIMSAASLI